MRQVASSSGLAFFRIAVSVAIAAIAAHLHCRKMLSGLVESAMSAYKTAPLIFTADEIAGVNWLGAVSA